MTHPAYIREKALQLRTERKLTIAEIAERLALPRTTVYGWVRDLPVPRKAVQSGPREAARRKGNRAMQRKYRLLREAAQQEGEASFDELAADPTFRDFVALYIAEGSKRERNCVCICNSDPAVMTLATRWMRRFTQKALILSVQYHADQDLEELRRFWGETLGFEASEIGLQRKSNSNQLAGRTWRSVHGVLSIRAYDTMLRARLEAWMCRLRSSWQ